MAMRRGGMASAVPMGGPIGGGSGEAGVADVAKKNGSDPNEAVDNKHLLRRKQKKQKKKRKQQMQSIVAESNEPAQEFENIAEDGDDFSDEEDAARPPAKTVKRSAKSAAHGGAAAASASGGRGAPWDKSPVECLEWLLDPIDLKTFFSEYWETKPLLIRRKNRQRFKGLFSSQQLDDVIRSNYIKYGVNIDMARYSDGVRTTENPEGRVHANTMWALYEDGCSIRMLNPQTYAKPVWQLISTLQEYFQCMVGCNTYLTPPGAQGFAPHYDDIEALILQLEGSKRWRLYNNPTGERLPRTSSRNFDQSELSEPILDVVLQPGDFLYFPRGMAHQAVSTPDEHSLHITLSTYQLFDWAEYFKKLVPAALDYAIAEDAEFREGLPLQALNHVGLLHSETEGDNQRKRFMDKAKHLFQKLIDVAPYDSAADAVAVDFLHASMPSYLTSEELALTSRQKQLAARSNPVELSSPALAPSDWIRLIRPSMCRLVADSPEIVLLYHNQDNAMVWHEEEPQSLEFPVDFAPALEQLLLAQDFVRVDRLPELDEATQCDLATALYDAGLVMRHTQEEMEAD